MHGPSTYRPSFQVGAGKISSQKQSSLTSLVSYVRVMSGCNISVLPSLVPPFNLLEKMCSFHLLRNGQRLCQSRVESLIRHGDTNKETSSSSHINQ